MLEGATYASDCFRRGDDDPDACPSTSSPTVELAREPMETGGLSPRRLPLRARMSFEEPLREMESLRMGMVTGWMDKHDVWATRANGVTKYWNGNVCRQATHAATGRDWPPPTFVGPFSPPWDTGLDIMPDYKQSIRKCWLAL